MSTLIAPSVSYVSSQDVNSMSSGTTTYLVSYPSSDLCGNNIIMFEYKKQINDSSGTNLDNTEFGFISVDTIIEHIDNNNQMKSWILPISSDNTTYDGVSAHTISVRIYIGTQDQAQVIVTPWSEPSLPVYEPAATPFIFTSEQPYFNGSFYDNSVNELYVLLEKTNNQYDFENMDFIVCFFFENISGETVWKVSDPTQAIDTTFGSGEFKLITVPLDGTVSQNNTNVYVSLHATYKWVYGNNNYYSLSYISNEVTSVPSTNDSDSDPNITSVVYNIYNEVAVPGDQTMTVSWEPPGHSVLPLFKVSHYNLYYSINDGSFNLYGSDISHNILEYNVVVGNDDLNMQCGDNIKFRVDAILDRGDIEQSPVSDSTNFFKYSQAVTNLNVKYSTWNDSNDTASFNILFDGVSDSGTPNKGCGEAINYVIKINGEEFTGVGDLTYESGKSYEIQFTDLSINQVGTVEVYLNTRDTNSTFIYKGLSATVPYISNVINLADIEYNVYSTQLNEQQIMALSWTDPALPDWTVDHYIIQLSKNNGNAFSTVDTTTNLNYNFDASGHLNPSSENFTFRIVAKLTHPDTGDDLESLVSNYQSKNTFKYATDVIEPRVNWSISDISQNKMDMHVTFKNSEYTGINLGLQYYKISVLDSSNNIISTKDVNYIQNKIEPYNVKFNDISYSPVGSVSFEPFVKDSNSNNNITSVNYVQNPGYTTSTIPIIKNFNMDSLTEMTCDIISQGPLKPFASLIVRPEELPSTEPGNFNSFYTISDYSEQLQGITMVGPTIDSNDSYLYTLRTDISAFINGAQSEKFRFLYNVADDAGVGSQLVQLQTNILEGGAQSYELIYSFPPMTEL